MTMNSAASEHDVVICCGMRGVHALLWMKQTPEACPTVRTWVQPASRLRHELRFILMNQAALLASIILYASLRVVRSNSGLIWAGFGAVQYPIGRFHMASRPRGPSQTLLLLMQQRSEHSRKLPSLNHPQMKIYFRNSSWCPVREVAHNTFLG